MQLLSALLFGISASLDALIIGITYGIKKIKISLLQNILISLITLAGTVISIGLGSSLKPLLSAQTARIAGSTLLMMLGLYYILKYIRAIWKKYSSGKNLTINEIQGASTVESEEDKKNRLSIQETAILGLALSVNNIGIGISASIAGLSLLPTAIATFICSVCFLLLGTSVGKVKILNIADKYSDLLTGLILIGLGIFELI